MHINPARDKARRRPPHGEGRRAAGRAPLADRDALAALPWVRLAHRSLRRLLRTHTHVEVRAALRIVAAEGGTGDLTAAANAYSTRGTPQAPHPSWRVRHPVRQRECPLPPLSCGA